MDDRKNMLASLSRVFLLIALLFILLAPRAPRRTPVLQAQPKVSTDSFIGPQVKEFFCGLLSWMLVIIGLFALIYWHFGPTVMQVVSASSTASPTTFTTKVYESQALVAATTSLILTGIAVSIPVIMLMWSQLTDSLNHLYHTLTPSSQNHHLVMLRRLLEQAKALNDFAVKYLPHLLYAVAAILLLLLIVLIFPPFLPPVLFELTGKTVFYYLFLAYSAFMTGLAALSFVFFLYCVLKVRIVTTKVEIQLTTLGYDIDV